MRRRHSVPSRYVRAVLGAIDGIVSTASLASDQQSIFNDNLKSLSTCFGLVQLTPENLDMGGSNDTERDSIALDLDDFDSDIAVDNQLLTNFAT